jgi:protein-S-isoprenylcysteine O-methyltransferase Ste14
MAEKMSLWGVGPKIGRWTFCYLAVAVAATLVWPAVFSIGFVPRCYLAAAGGALLLLTAPLYVVTVRGVAGAHREDRLVTTGPYALCRHPLYALWILFVVPAVAAFLASWLVLSASLFMYVVTRIATRHEEAYLEQRFGEAYREYKRRVNAVLPTVWRR